MSKQSKQTVRCAVYTRKSTNEGLEKEFNSLDAQREACESYIKSQKESGWTILPRNYSDGGFTGGNIERPAMQELLEDIRNDEVDIVVVYKVDRLSRSLLDFAQLMRLFENHKVGFVSVTQQFDTTNSMGRLTLNMLLSFAQFEREMISERTRDKLSSMRKKGKWLGGRPVLGYDVQPNPRRLIINKQEAKLVKTIFTQYIELQSTHAVAQYLNEHNHRTKLWNTRDGLPMGGTKFNATRVQAILRNATYTGMAVYQKELYPGEHEAIIDQETFDKAQSILDQNRREKASIKRHSGSHLLKGLFRCGHCGCAMTTSFCIKKDRRYYFYRCHSSFKHHNTACPNKNMSAHMVENEVITLLKRIAEAKADSLDPIKQALLHILRSAFEVWDMLFPKARSEFLRSILKSITYHHGEKRIDLEFDEDQIARIAETVGIMQEAASC